MTTHTASPPGAITYEQWLRQYDPKADCGPDVIDDRRWWQHLPGLNPYADLERQAGAARHQAEKEAGG